MSADVETGAFLQRFRGLGRAVFGDRRGVAIFLAALLFYAIYWRVGVFIVDTPGLANAFVNLAEGHLHLDHAVYGNSIEARGVMEVDGVPYGRNYGQLFATLPVYWALQGVSAIADPRIAIAGAWSLGIVALGWVLAPWTARREQVRVAAAALALVLFGANVLTAHELQARLLPLAAMQVTAMLAAGLAGVVAYRLLAVLHGVRAGTAAGVFVALGSPVAFWAPVPKRHVFTVLLALVTLYGVARSRSADGGSERLGPTGHRALAYVAVGLLTWVHAAEGLAFFLALVVVDLPTAHANDRRTLAVVGGAFILSMLPFVLTNIAVSGNPIKPPRMFSPYIDPGPAFPSADGGASSGGGAGGGGMGGGGIQIPGIGYASALGDEIAGRYLSGYAAIVQDPGRVAQTIGSSHEVPGAGGRGIEHAANFSMLEVAPILGALLAVPVLAVRRIRRGVQLRGLLTPVDGVALLFAVMVVGLFQNHLPLRGQYTVRYLLPLFVVGGYSLLRLGVLRRLLRSHGRRAGLAAIGTTVLGAPGLLVLVATRGLTSAGALETQSALNLLVAGVVALLAVAAVVDARFDRPAALAMGVAVGATVVYVLLTGLVHFHTAPHALGLVNEAMEAVRLALVRATIG